MELRVGVVSRITKYGCGPTLLHLLTVKSNSSLKEEGGGGGGGMCGRDKTSL